MNETKIELQQHQKSAVKKFDKTPGVIYYHGLGSGKTLTSIAASEKTPGNILVTTPASLLSNYEKELDKFNVKKDRYKLVSLETFRKNPDLYVNKYKPSTLVVDEFHRSRSEDSLTNEALNKARPKIKKFIGLTGSLINNDPTELVPLINLAAGGPVFKNTETFSKDFLKHEQVSPGFFAKHFLKAKSGEIVKPKNIEAFKRMASPYIHSFSGNDEYLKHVPTTKKETIRITMSPEQQKMYDFVNKKMPIWMRYKIKHNLPPSKSESKNLNAFFSASRQVSNSIEPFGDKTETPKLNKMLHDLKHGLKTDKNFKSITFSNYLDAGLKPYSELLNKNKIKHAIFSGEESQKERTKMINDYNKGKLKHLLISPAGVEGLDLKATKLVQKMEPDWNPERSNQAYGRAARFMSHESLPEKEREVLVKEYLSIPRLGIFGKIKRFFRPEYFSQGTDDYIRNRSIEKEKLNESFINALKEIK